MGRAATRQLTKVQIGKQVSAGTAVAATRRLSCRNPTYRRMEELAPIEGTSHGTLDDAVHLPVMERQWTEFDIPMDFDFEQILFPLLAGVKGGVAPTEPGTGTSRLWSFEPAADADPAPDLYTAEYSEKSVADEAGMESEHVFATGFTVRGGDNRPPEVTVQAVGRATVDSTPTAALAVPVLKHGSSQRWAFYMDDAAAGLGGTQVVGQMYGFEARYRGPLRPGWYKDNRADHSFSTYDVGTRALELTLDIAHDPASAAFVQTEEALKSTPTRRFGRLQIDGPAFAAPDAAFNHFFRIDGCFYHLADSMQERGRDRDGNLIVRAHLMSIYDPTWTLPFGFYAQNTLTAFP